MKERTWRYFKRHKWLLIFTGIFLLLTPQAFKYADYERGYDSTGGEMFFPFIPLVIWMVGKSMTDLFSEDKHD